MRTKNTRELRLRADSHARNDHILQGTYGKVRKNGHVDYRGCAVSCLAVPHRKRDLAAYLKDFLAGRKKGQWHEYGSGERHRQSLQDEFGLEDRLIVLAEGFFEAQVTHAEAIDFVRDFAHAVPEGVDIRGRDTRAFSLWAGLPVRGSYTQIVERLRPRRWGYEGNRRANAGEKARVRAATADFLTWLRSGAHVSKMPKSEAVAV